MKKKLRKLIDILLSNKVKEESKSLSSHLNIKFEDDLIDFHEEGLFFRYGTEKIK